jgi:hypothetical protein
MQIEFPATIESICMGVASHEFDFPPGRSCRIHKHTWELQGKKKGCEPEEAVQRPKADELPYVP